jgi:uncharacterized repeat protein (TIGR03803 family)
MKFIEAGRLPACAFGLVLLLGLSLLGATAQASQFTLNPLFTFTCDPSGNCPNGEVPTSLIQSADGTFYGTTAFGGSGSNAAGTVFKLAPSGELTTIFTFTNDQNGANPSNLVEGNDGFLYGLTSLPNDTGNALFKLSKAGNMMAASGVGGNLYNLVLAGDGNFYACTLDADPTPGQVIRITPSGSVTSIHTFDLNTEGPACLGVILGADNNLYGTTLGAQTVHTSVFRLTTAGQFTILHTLIYSEFAVSPASQTADGLIRGVVSHISGTTQPAMFAIEPSGADYEEIPLFYGFPQGANSPAVRFMIQPSDGSLWGVFDGVASENVVNFTLKSALLEQIQYSGTGSPATLLQASNGTLVGLGTGEGPGEIFTVDPGLSAPAPLFVHSGQTGGKPGSQVMIQGSSFIGATAVSFHGVSASFQVLNTGNILATIPQGATTGRIAVTNAGGTTQSKKNFIVE